MQGRGRTPPSIYPTSSIAQAGPPPAGGLDDSLMRSAGAPLPLGAVVPGSIPGLYESGTSTPLLHDPVMDPDNPTATAPARSRYTLVQAGPQPGRMENPGYDNPIVRAGPMSPRGLPLTPDGSSGIASPDAMAGPGPRRPAYSPQQDLSRNATSLALSQIFNSGPAGTPGAAPAGGGGSPGSIATQGPGPLDAMGNGGRLMAAAAGFEGTQLNLAAQDEMRRLSPMAPLPADSPGVRANKLAYFNKLMTDQVAQDPTLSAGGVVPSLHTLSDTAHQLMTEAGQPRFKSLGQDSQGRPVEGTVDRNGNFSRIAPEKNDPKNDQPEYSADGKFYRSGPKDDWKPVASTNDRPPTTTEWMFAVSNNPEERAKGYVKFVREWKKENEAYIASEAAAKNAAAKSTVKKPTVAAPTPSPAPVYRAEDVQAEMRRRGLIK